MHKFLPLSLLLVMSAGCANTDLLVQRQTSLEGRLEQLAQAQSSATTRLGEVETELQSLREQLKKVAAEQEAGRELPEKLDRLSQRLDRIETDLPPMQATRIEVVNKESGSDGRDHAVQDAYLKAFGLFSANNFPAAAEAFTSFITSYPESEYAVNAWYWLGECYYSEGKYHQAIESFERVVNGSPSAKKVPDALLKMGLSWFGLNETAKGSSILHTLIDKYPDSTAASKARERLLQP